MWSRTAWARAALILMPVSLFALVAACGGGDNKTSSAPSPATNAPATQPGGSIGSSVGSSASANTITIVATDNKFDKTSLTVKSAQEVSLTLDNKGTAIHNWHVTDVKDKDGKDIMTKLINGDQSDAIKFTIDKAGTYDYHCDVHPEMTGKLTVQ